MKPSKELQKFRKDLWQDGNAKTYGAMLRGDDAEQTRYMAEVYQAVSANPKLLKANRWSLLASIGTAAAMGMSIMPQLGEAWLIPRAKGKGDQRENFVNFQIGYKGLVKLAHRSGLVDSIDAEVVYFGEPYKRLGGTRPGIDHEPLDGDPEIRNGKFDSIRCAYAIVWLKGSSRPTYAVVPRWELLSVRSSTGSRAYGDRPAKPYTDVWRDHPAAMCLKTALIRVCKRLPRHDGMRLLQRVVEAELMMEGGRQPLQIFPTKVDKLQASDKPSEDDVETDDDLADMVPRPDFVDTSFAGPEPDDAEPEPDDTEPEPES